MYKLWWVAADKQSDIDGGEFETEEQAEKAIPAWADELIQQCGGEKSQENQIKSGVFSVELVTEKNKPNTWSDLPMAKKPTSISGQSLIDLMRMNPEVARVVKAQPGWDDAAVTYALLRTSTGGVRLYRAVNNSWRDASLEDITDPAVLKVLKGGMA